MIDIFKKLIEAGLDAKLVTYPYSYIRIGYWKKIPFDILKKFNLREEELHDDDCGTLYSYYEI